MTYTFRTATEAWDGIYSILKQEAVGGFVQPSRAGNVVGELINQTVVITDPTHGIVLSEQRGMDIRYAVGELMWYLSASNRLKDITKYSKFWNKISDDGETSNSAYGYRIHKRFGFDQWEYVKQLLTDDPYSRQAVIHIKNPSNEESKDVSCTLSLQFLIRDGALFLSTVMRSNDIWLGFPFDVFCFTAMQVKMAMELGVELGDYTHFVGSLHLYERDVDKSGASKNTNAVLQQR